MAGSVHRVGAGAPERERGLGGYSLVSLQDARDAALDSRRALHRGENFHLVI